VAEDEMVVIPLGAETLLATAALVPEQLGPIIAITFSTVTSLSAAAVAAAASIHVESARTAFIFVPPRNIPESDASLMANSAAAAMGGVRDSMGPVNACNIPIFTVSAATHTLAILMAIATLNMNLRYVFIRSSLL
jgi:hypothetical protein